VNTKPEFKRDLGVTIITELIDAPDSQVSEEVRAHLRALHDRIATCTATDLFDGCVAISKLPLTEVSRFVRVLCDVEQFYSRPQES